MTVSLLRTRVALAEALDGSRRDGRHIALVPTLGALHEGHLSLIERARSAADIVVVSVFVNPTQFTDPTDFARYPRTLEHDVALVSEAGGDVVFAPAVSELYPDGAEGIWVDPGPLGDLLEGSSRPGHFRGVATVVTKLLNAVAPATAYFGEKDYQQLLVVRQLAAALLLRTEIVGCPTVREEDGLARSSRNAQLSKTEREAAPVLYRALVAGAAALSREEPEGVETEMAEVVAKEPLAELDYAVVRDAATLGAPGEGPRRLLITARVGPVRLIDNLAPEQVVGLH